jgi:hypothetical protein
VIKRIPRNNQARNAARKSSKRNRFVAVAAASVVVTKGFTIENMRD